MSLEILSCNLLRLRRVRGLSQDKLTSTWHSMSRQSVRATPNDSP